MQDLTALQAELAATKKSIEDAQEQRIAILEDMIKRNNLI